VEDRDDLEWDELERRAGRRIWLDDPESLTPQIRTEVRGACLMLGALATSLAPSFFKDQFELKLEIEPLVDWGATGPNLRLVICDRHRGVEFPADAIADGYKLWIEIALAESVVVFHALHWHPRTSYTSEAIEEALADIAFEGFDSREFAQAFRWPAVGSQFAAASSELRLFLVKVLLRFRSPGRIAYVIDEPEQHLHPRLQRQAAAWLTEIVDERGSQVIVATHSPHFLRSGPQASFTYVHPTSTGSHALSFDPLEFDAFGAGAEEMGFDRGELLSGIELVLFVEGEADRRLLVATFAAELHQAGIVIVPIHGAKDAEGKGIVDSEMVLRFTSAKLAIMLDKVTVPAFLELKMSRAARDAAGGKSGSGIELRHLARTVQRALELDRDIELIPIGADDIFDLIDEEILRERFAFPGHAAARHIAAEARQKCGTKWKDVYRELWNIDVLDMTLFDELGCQMAESERVPSQLQQVLVDLKRTAA
jgi:AAA domain, putative AbiEii toxin, Type IV TA system